MPHLRLAVLIPAAFALPAATPVEQIIPVPGFADFLTVDGNSVWVTNKGRVERWSRQGKLATVMMRHPCGTMALTADALWVADCDDKTLSRIDRRKARITSVIAPGIAAADGEMNVVAGAGSVWLASATSGVISRIDPARLEEWSGIAGRDRLWLAPKLPPEADVPAVVRASAQTVLMDTFHAAGFGGSGLTGDWAKFARHRVAFPGNFWFLAGGLNETNIGDALAASGARFVDVNSGVESSPGVKDEAKLRRFADALRVAAGSGNPGA